MSECLSAADRLFSREEVATALGQLGLPADLASAAEPADRYTAVGWAAWMRERGHGLFPSVILKLRATLAALEEEVPLSPSRDSCVVDASEFRCLELVRKWLEGALYTGVLRGRPVLLYLLHNRVLREGVEETAVAAAAATPRLVGVCPSLTDISVTGSGLHSRGAPALVYEGTYAGPAVELVQDMSRVQRARLLCQCAYAVAEFHARTRRAFGDLTLAAFVVESMDSCRVLLLEDGGLTVPAPGIHGTSITSSVAFMYRNPEGFVRKTLEAATIAGDVYMFGSMAFEVAYGVPPFAWVNYDCVIFTRLADPEEDCLAAAKSRGLLPPALLPSMDWLLQACLAFDPATRPSMHAVARCLEFIGGATADADGRQPSTAPAPRPAV